MIINLFFFNLCFDKSRLKNLISWSLKNYGEKNTIELVENLKELGFQYATQAGISLSPDDLKIPPTKSWLVSEAEIKIRSTQVEYQRGYLTAVEKFQQLIDTWHRTSETLKQNVVQHFRSTDILNPVYMMAFSGARGNLSQVRQLVGMRGLMADPQGQIIDFPIRSNFREGLTLTEYFISCYGARKGLVDTALRTANSGYLTRRLVDVSHHVIVCEFDCKTERGIFLSDMKQGEKTILSLENRLIGRILAENITFFTDQTKKLEQNFLPSKMVPSLLPLQLLQWKKQKKQRKMLPSPMVPKELESNKILTQTEFPDSRMFISEENKKLQTKKSKNKYYFSKKSILIARNQEICANLASKIIKIKKKVLVRSPLTCESKKSICQLCYGWSLADGNLVSLGEAVGILAAQSIGEPGTQLTMRTFHTGGVFSGDVMEEIRAPFTGNIKYSEALQGVLVRTPHGKVAFLTKISGELLLNSASDKNKHKIKKFRIPNSTILFVRENELVVENQLIAEFSSMSTNSNQRIQAKHNLNSELEGQIFFEDVDLDLKFEKEGNTTRTSRKLGSIWLVSGKLYQSILPSSFFPKVGDLIDTKSLMNQTFMLSPYNGFIDFQMFSPNNKFFASQKEKNSLFVNPQKKSFHIFKNSTECSIIPLSLLSRRKEEIVEDFSEFYNSSTISDGTIGDGRARTLSPSEMVESSELKFGKILNSNRFFLPQTSFEEDTSFYKNIFSSNTDNFSNNYLKICNLTSKKIQEIILSNSIGSLNLKNIKYKKYGYFLDLSFKSFFHDSLKLKLFQINKNTKYEQDFFSSCFCFSNFYSFILQSRGSFILQSRGESKSKRSKNTIGDGKKTLFDSKIKFSESSPYALKYERVKQVFIKTKFFLANSIEQEFKNINQIKQFFYLQAFSPNYNTKSGGFLFLETNYLNETLTEGQFFWFPEENYKFNKQKLFFPNISDGNNFKNQKNSSTISDGTIGDSRAKTRFESKKPFLKHDSLEFYNSSCTIGDGNRTLFESSNRKILLEQELDLCSEVRKNSSQTKWIKKDFPIISKLNFQGNPLSFFSNFHGLATILKPKKNLLEKNIITISSPCWQPGTIIDGRSESLTQKDIIKDVQKLYLNKKRWKIHRNNNQNNLFSVGTISDGTISDGRELCSNWKKVFCKNPGITFCLFLKEGRSKTLLESNNYHFLSKLKKNKKNLIKFHEFITNCFIKNYFYSPFFLSEIRRFSKEKVFLGNFKILLIPQFPFSKNTPFTNHISLDFHLNKDGDSQRRYQQENNSSQFNKNESLVNYKKNLFKQSDYLKKGLFLKQVSKNKDKKLRDITDSEIVYDSNFFVSQNKGRVLDQKNNFRIINSLDERKKTISKTRTEFSTIKDGTKRNNHFIHVKIKPGWIYFPKNQKYSLKYHKSLYRSGLNFIDTVLFDQHIIYVEYISTKNYLISQFLKPSKKLHFDKSTLKQFYPLPSPMVPSEMVGFCKNIIRNDQKLYASLNTSSAHNIEIFTEHKKLKRLGEFLQIFFFSFRQINKKRKNVLKSFTKTFTVNRLGTIFDPLLLPSVPRYEGKRQKKKEFLMDKNSIRLYSSQVKKLMLQYETFLLSFYFTQFLVIGFTNSDFLKSPIQETTKKIKYFNLFKIYFIENKKHRFYKFLNSNSFRKPIETKNLFNLKTLKICPNHYFLENTEDSHKILKLVHKKSSIKNTNFLRVFHKEKKTISRFFCGKREITNDFCFSFLLRNQINPKLFILFRKANEYTLLDHFQNKKLVYETTKLQANSVTPTFDSSMFSHEEIFHLKITNFPWLNKQKITNLVLPFPSIDFQINCFLRFKTSQKNHILKQTNFLEIFLSLLIPNNYPLKYIKIQLIPETRVSNRNLFSLLSSNFVYQKVTPSSLVCELTNNRTPQLKKICLFYLNALNNSINFSVFRKIELSSFMTSELKNRNNFDAKQLSSSQLLLYSNNWTFKINPLSLTCFFSPYEGEITNIKTDSFGKQNCLFLTNHDQLSFSTRFDSSELKFGKFFLLVPSKMVENSVGVNSSTIGDGTIGDGRAKTQFESNLIPFVHVGQFLRYGEEFIQNTVIPASGQIIQVENSKVILRKAQPVLFSSRGFFHVYHKDFVEKNSPLMTLFYQRLKTGDIVQGIPQIEQFFEARQTKEGEILPENLHNKLCEFFEISRHHFSPQEAARKSLEKIQQILVDGVQKVYQSQGVTIDDKHLEIIVRQMTSKVKILHAGQSGLLRGELIDLDRIEVVNIGINLQKAEYEPVILGITKAALETESFISAASFQETTRILARAAIQRKTDFLRGLKENVILGQLIPAGTGFSRSFDPEISKSFHYIKNKNDNFLKNLFLNLDSPLPK
jgi:DNA-directed RNA polymerase subunit beta'